MQVIPMDDDDDDGDSVEFKIDSGAGAGAGAAGALPVSSDETDGLVKDTKYYNKSRKENDEDDPLCTMKTIALIVLFIVSLFGTYFIGFSTGKEFEKHELTDSSSTASPTTMGQHHNNHPPAVSVDFAKLAKAKVKAQETIDMLWNYYGSTAGGQLNTAFRLGFGSKEHMVNPDIESTKESPPIRQENFDYIVARIARALVHKEPFVIGAIGSSVVRGHDNCFADSFPLSLKALLGTVFNITDSNIIVRNGGEGGACEDNHQNQIFCFTNLVGTDIDILIYEWTYFGDKPFHRELLLRWLQLLPKAPSLVHLVVDEWEQRSENFAPETYYDGATIEKYSKYGFNAISIERIMYLNHKYKGKAWGVVGDGVHNVTRKGEKYIISDPEEYKSQGVVNRNWHPGPLGFQALVDAMSYYYLRAFIQAVDKIAESKQSLAVSFPKEIKKFEPLPTPILKETQNPHKNMSVTQFFGTLLNLEEEPPSCVTYEGPAYGKPSVGLEQPDSPFNPYDMKTIDNEHWKISKDGMHNLIPKKDKDRPECMHEDYCGAIVGKESSGWLVYRLPKVERGFIILCSKAIGCGSSCLSYLRDPEMMDVEFDSQPVDRSLFKALTSKCVIIQPMFTGPVHDATGHLYLALRVKKPNICCSFTQVMAG